MILHPQDIGSAPVGPVFGVKGVVAKVFPPRDPTPAQAKHGLHNQNITLSDPESGATCTVRINHEPFHLGQEAEGRALTILAGKSTRDTLIGLVKDEHNGKAYFEASKHAQVKLEQDIPLPPRAETKNHTTTMSDPIDALAGHHRRCYDAIKKAYAGTGVPIENLTALATTLFIEGNRSGVFRQQAPAPPQTPQTPRPTKKPPEDMTTEEITSVLHLAYRCRSEGKESPRVTDTIEQAVLRVIPWVEVLKPYKEAFLKHRSEDDWKRAMRVTRESLKLDPKDWEGLAKVIVTDQPSFEEIAG